MLVWHWVMYHSGPSFGLHGANGGGDTGLVVRLAGRGGAGQDQVASWQQQCCKRGPAGAGWQRASITAGKSKARRVTRLTSPQSRQGCRRCQSRQGCRRCQRCCRCCRQAGPAPAFERARAAGPVGPPPPASTNLLNWILHICAQGGGGGGITWSVPHDGRLVTKPTLNLAPGNASILLPVGLVPMHMPVQQRCAASRACRRCRRSHLLLCSAPPGPAAAPPPSPPVLPPPHHPPPA